MTAVPSRNIPPSWDRGTAEWRQHVRGCENTFNVEEIKRKTEETIKRVHRSFRFSHRLYIRSFLVITVKSAFTSADVTRGRWESGGFLRPAGRMQKPAGTRRIFLYTH